MKESKFEKPKFEKEDNLMNNKEALLEVLKSLGESRFAEVVFRLESTYAHLSADIPSRYASLTDRATELIRKLDERDGLDVLSSTIVKVAPEFTSKLK